MTNHGDLNQRLAWMEHNYKNGQMNFEDGKYVFSAVFLLCQIQMEMLNQMMEMKYERK